MRTVWLLYSVATLALFVKGLCLSLAQAWLRVRRRTFTIPEDASFFGVAPVATEAPSVARIAAVWRNDLECVPFFLAAGAAFAATGGAANWAGLYFGSFVLARLAHSAAYLGGKQPLRFYVWSASQVAVLAMAAHAIVIAWCNAGR